MADKYKKTAKDKAFDRERLKLQSQILRLRHELASKEEAIKALHKTLENQGHTINAQNKQLTMMVEILKMSDEDIALLLSREKRNAELQRFLKTMNICRSVGFY